ncbi:hypothetical protein DMX10_18115 [Pseudomonas sp. 57B-090624]|uniref:hypothetical protein n=1 Tax=Pseudomonas sp. 57B-090624 TaxID=2213080 RepID=UPI000DA8A783|nr:hypothetical protein [Pseudomonas sp. 57B-090624]PZE11999.1 hypothetical protein DMX10_18115 [Pseudomonas sp. 57B-090624]
MTSDDSYRLVHMLWRIRFAKSWDALNLYSRDYLDAVRSLRALGRVTDDQADVLDDLGESCFWHSPIRSGDYADWGPIPF